MISKLNIFNQFRIRKDGISFSNDQLNNFLYCYAIVYLDRAERLKS